MPTTLAFTVGRPRRYIFVGAKLAELSEGTKCTMGPSWKVASDGAGLRFEGPRAVVEVAVDPIPDAVDEVLRASQLRRKLEQRRRSGEPDLLDEWSGPRACIRSIKS